MLQTFEEEAKETGYPRLQITAAVSAGKGTIDTGYEIAEVGKWVWWTSQGPQILEQRFVNFLVESIPSSYVNIMLRKLVPSIAKEVWGINGSGIKSWLL